MRSIAKDREGYYWITAYNNLVRLDIKNQKIYSFEKELKATWDGLLGGEHIIVDKNDNIWIREHQGLLIYDKSKKEFIYHQHDQSGQPAFRGMRGLSVDEQGRIWIGTGRDFMAYAHSDSLSQGILKLYGAKEGLRGSMVTLAKPYKNKVLVFTNLGMHIFNPETRSFEKFYAADFGLNSLPGRATVLSNGKIALGQARAIVMFHPEKLKSNTEAIIPYIANFRVFDKEWNLNNIPSKPDTVYLSFKQNFFSFDFSSISFTLPEKTSYRYKLEGFDEDWQDGTKRKFAAYTNVPGGHYQFKVEATNSEGLKLGTTSVTHLFISTVWYKTFWFWFLIIAGLLWIAYSVYTWRIRQVRKEERLKSDYERKLTDVEMSALRAQMNPHFIFNSLNSIEYYIISNDPEKASDYLNRFS